MAERLKNTPGLYNPGVGFLIEPFGLDFLGRHGWELEEAVINHQQAVEFGADPIWQGFVGDDGDVVAEGVAAYTDQGVGFEAGAVEEQVGHVNTFIGGSAGAYKGDALKSRAGIDFILPGDQFILASHAFGQRQMAV